LIKFKTPLPLKVRKWKTPRHR